MEINLEFICNEYYKNCENCPLLIKQINISASDYDTCNINICYKKEYNTIKKIQLYLENLMSETENQSNCDICLKKDCCIVKNKEEVKNNCKILVEKKER